MAGTVGRPRKQSPRRRGSTAREEILDASSELFTRHGFATTSTHQIAEAVGMRQASLYYHFPSKNDIFMTLLMSTIQPALDLASDLAESDESPALKLWALVAAETRILLSSNWNIGRLYQLPVLTNDEFAEYHAARAQLEGIYRDLAAQIVGEDDPRIELPFHMTLAAIEMRDNTGIAPYPLVDDALPAPSVTIADAVLDVLHADIPQRRGERTLELVSRVSAEMPTS
ncbi:HTH-type transcriptional regulator AcrR [Corynebacterium glaucum]|uniref:HTH-type transcriptional regulator AcrR n=1 Tax=Corynebacterium glaucum TaxID=187491 RepID=A0A1Q2HV58_9CORY|nr:TetR/AcrR family transcriptional regulator [Corynebacterium glaucum]AQQ14723.1 HTH-type transcriptional regulator AcrR [Corynebacterium glaucum]WJZ07231.1 HTH-type transcriptional regulator AcrR [Corynebacterium glaucum]